VVQEGDKAPDFTLPDDAGQQVTLSELEGHWVVFWWYPKASTAG
jgi:peroxiredoxin Q/BCP